ncbi:MAG: membrane protein insertion efficiency factor YidD [Chloroflexi bacterium]|nr:membrane protein insertion efficiency factor YidD [Chloroflexota bacterium]
MREVALTAIHLYQRAFSPYWGKSCRYEPTCSRYSYEAIAKYGVLKGLWLSMKRLGSCHPLGGQGYDPVP